jgi:MarR family transcriptional regulator for hemolysin
VPETDERYLGLLLSDSARLLRTVFDRRVRALGLTRSPWLVLRRLDWHPGASQSELAEVMELEKATAGRLIDRLEENGWVERRPDPADRRIKRIYMTEEGERVNNIIRPISRAIVDEALSGLPPEDQEKLIDMMIEVKRRFLAMAGEGGQGEAAVPELEEA